MRNSAMQPPPYLNEEIFAPARWPRPMIDQFWAQGWRRFGPTLFRYSLMASPGGDIDVIVPLRLEPATFSATRSQRRVLRNNADVSWDIAPATLAPEFLELFEKHRHRFASNTPESLSVFLGDDPAASPCECLAFRCLVRGRVIAASFLDVGESAVSAVYAVFDPVEARRSPGTLTMLREIEWSREQGLTHYYPGYTTLGAGVYDYKKNFGPAEGFDWWTSEWRPWEIFRGNQTPAPW